MALVDVSDKVKAIIVLVLDLLAIGLLGFAEIFGWELPLWSVITDMVAMVLLSVLGIAWVVPERKSS